MYSTLCSANHYVTWLLLNFHDAAECIVTYSDSMLFLLISPIHNKGITLNPCCVCRAVAGLHGSSGKLTGSTSSLNKLTVQGSNSRRSQSSSLLDMGNMSASDLDVADRTKFDKVTLPEIQQVVCSCHVDGEITCTRLFLQIFEQVLSELEPLCLAEQDFITKFFKLQQPPTVIPPLAQVNI